jgi:16S rRNA (cytidine(1402)-2'-O)-methyltransferase
LAGRLLVCATPIGNLGDVTLRVLEALRDADVIEAEDTRVTRKLLARYDIHTPLEAYHAKNLEQRTPAVVERVRSGETVALVSDAGTPGIADRPVVISSKLPSETVREPAYCPPPPSPIVTYAAAGTRSGTIPAAYRSRRDVATRVESGA